MSEGKPKKFSGSYNRKRKALREKMEKQLSGTLNTFLIESGKRKKTDDYSLPQQCNPCSEDIKTTETQEITPSSCPVPTGPHLNLTDTEGTENHNMGENYTLQDPGTWPNALTIKQRDYLIKHPPCQISKWNFPRDNFERKFSTSYYLRVLPNGEQTRRMWLLYSVSKDSVFCLYCKLFGDGKSQLTNEFGCKDWRHLSYILSNHEKSGSHVKCSTQFAQLRIVFSKNKTIDAQEQRLYETERKYWYSVIERIIYAIQFLARQCIAFRGSSLELYNNNNGNFLKLMETFAKFDPIVAEHLRRVQTSESQNMTHYLGVQIQNEIISLLSDAISQNILEMTKDAKYFSIILDTTPDVNHVDQMSIIIRFVHYNKEKTIAEIREHFLGFYSVQDTTGQGLYEFILDRINKFNLDIQNLRGQGYDNGANMRGKYNGLQQKIIEINPRAFYVPCSAHTLNLVVNDAAKITFETVNFFNIVQELYNFFSASTKRWNVLDKHLTNLTLKPLSNTRWESRINAIKPLKIQTLQIYEALLEISNDKSRDMDTRCQANSLILKITNFKFICSVVIWHDILSKINVVSKILQSQNFDISEALEQLKNLTNILSQHRSNNFFENIISSATKIAELLDVEPSFLDNLRQRRKKSISIMNLKTNVLLIRH